MRRSHTKSRTGCANCKRRKVKCDEIPPACFNRRRHNVPCSLSPGMKNGSASPDQDGLPPAAQPDLIPSSRPSAMMPGDGGPSPASAAHPGEPDDSSQITPFPPQELWRRDFELMHHYSTTTADTMSLRRDMAHVWRDAIPRVGYQYPFVAHGTLALAAVHKAYLIPHHRKTYLNLAAYHQTVGSEGFRRELQCLSDENWMSLFSFASVVVLYMVTLPTRLESQRLEDPITNTLKLIGLLKGIKTTPAPVLPRVASSEFPPLMYGVWPSEQTEPPEGFPPLDHTNLPLNTWEGLRKLRDFQKDEIPSNSREDYEAVVHGLEDTVRLVAFAGTFVETGAILVWMYGIPESILVDIDARQPHAILILAYYAVLLASTERSFWYSRGWGMSLLKEIEAKLADQPKFSKWLQWPKNAVHAFDIYI